MTAPFVALYVSSRSLSPNQLSSIQHTFDTAQDYPEIDPVPGWIRAVPSSEWAIGMSAEDIFARHSDSEETNSDYYFKPIVVLDDRTAEDESVLLVSPVLRDDDEWEFLAIRFSPDRVPGAAMNLSISNQTLEDYADVSTNGIETVTIHIEAADTDSE
ncbi:hypothetical protein BD779DRAFT_938193 [Infundibulicybe gibba]|nr:hypothetical protein BD779DRAFT_938193 [Infundibulicybe gibba]